MTKTITDQKKQILLRVKFVLVLLFIYIALFEFILPVNKVLPRPTLLLESLLAVWGDYNLIYEVSVSTFIIYSSIIAGYFLIWISRVPLLKLLAYFGEGLNNFRVFRFFPALFYAVIFAFWFPASITAEFFFALIAVLFYLTAAIKDNLKSISESHIFIAKNLQVPANKLLGEIFWKNLQPLVLSSLLKMHFFIWILVMIFEYVGDYTGLGHVYNKALGYYDFAGLFSLAIYIALLIWLGDSVIKFIKSKIIYWEK